MTPRSHERLPIVTPSQPEPAVHLVVRAPVPELEELLARARAAWRRGGSVVCDVEGTDLSLVEAVARLLLESRQVQGSLSFEYDADAAALLAYCGLLC